MNESVEPSQRRRSRRPRFRTAIAIVALLCPAGCAGAGVAVASAGASAAVETGVDYTLNGIAFKTLTAPIDKVKVATRTGFQRMGMKKTKDQKSEKGWDFEATANERVVTIELQALTPKTTRMRVVADDGIFFKDRATESELIFQIADALDHTHRKVRAATARR